jgi:hypothetical protein
MLDHKDLKNMEDFGYQTMKKRKNDKFFINLFNEFKVFFYIFCINFNDSFNLRTSIRGIYCRRRNFINRY